MQEGPRLGLPRLAGRLTAELISRSPQYINAVKDYELDLRGVLMVQSLLGVGCLESRRRDVG
jgi:hypothetical protein